MNPILSIKDLSINFLSYSVPYGVVKNISFDIFSGESIALVGESGSGKSITAKAILGLNPQENSYVDSGEVLYNGNDLLQYSQSKMQEIRGSEIAIIFQDPMASLNPTMKVGLQIFECVRIHNPKLTKNDAYNEVIDLLELVGIPMTEERFHQYPYELSGGMRQRVMIAIALARKPKILIADEPTTALDVTIQAQIISLLKTLQEKLSMSILFITHDLSLAAKFCDRILVMYHGRIVEEADTKVLFQCPSHPYTQKLLQSIPRINQDPDEKLIPIMGSPPTIYDQIEGCGFYSRCPHAMKICKDRIPKLKLCSSGQKCACWLKEETHVHSSS